MLQFLQDLYTYCLKNNINFSNLTNIQQKEHIRRCLKKICQCGRYKL